MQVAAVLQMKIDKKMFVCGAADGDSETGFCWAAVIESLSRLKLPSQDCNELNSERKVTYGCSKLTANSHKESPTISNIH